MKVGVACFGSLRDYLPDDAHGNRIDVEVDDGATVTDVISAFGPPDRLVYMILVNDEQAEADHALQDGDSVTLMPAFTGGL